MTLSPSRSGFTSLKKSSEYRQVYENGTLFKAGSLRVYLLSTAGKGVRAGISISSRTVRSAVGRNRHKRIIREWFRQAARGKAERSADIVVVVKKDYALNKTGSKALRQELSKLLTSKI